MLLITVSMAKITNKLIIASMTKSELNIWDTSLCPLLVMFLNQYWGLWLPENKLIYIWNGFIIYFTYLVHVVGKNQENGKFEMKFE